MWFLLGMLTVALSSAGLAWWRGRTRWQGSLEVDGVEADTHVSKNRLRGITVGARTRTRLEFDLKPEGTLDRWAKSVGLSIEGELGHGRFDRELYLVADDPQVVGALRRDRAIAEALLAVFDAGGPGVERPKRLVCRGGVVRVHATCNVDQAEAAAIAARFAPALTDVARALESAAAGSARPDPLWWRSTLLVSIAGGLAINGFAQGLRVLVGRLPDTLDDGAVFAMALFVGGLVLAALVAATLFLLGRTSRAHLVLLEVLLVGGFGAVATAAVELRDLNVEAATAEPVTHETVVESRHEHRGRRGSRSWSVTLAPWPGSDGSVDVKVDSSEHSASPPGTPVVVTTREGFLGWTTLESVRRVRH
jgi:hypothetical protein